MKTAIAAILATCFGIFFAYVDNWPNFDDTGVLAVAIAVSSFVIAALFYRRAWLVALGVGVWIPLHNILMSRGWGSLLALGFAFAGAYTGAFMRSNLFPPVKKDQVAAS